MHSAIELESEEVRNASFDKSKDVAAKDWHNWCRLCAKADIQNINIFLKDENLAKTEDSMEHKESGLSIAIGKYFNVEMKPDEQLPVQLCTDCFLLITSLINFNERVVKVQQMYIALQHFEEAVTDFQALRLKYGVLENDRPHEFMHSSLTEIQLLEGKLQTHNHDKISFDEKADVDILQQPHTVVQIKKENSNDLTLPTDEDVCDFENEDTEGEDPFGSDVEFNNNDEASGNTENTSSKIKGKDETSSRNMSIKENCLNDKNNEYKTRRLLYPKRGKKSLKKVEIASTGVTCIEGCKKENPYTCAECSKAFKVFAFYRSHMQRKHAIADVAPRFVCSECPLSFNTPTQLNHHHTSKHLPITERRNVLCSFCEQKFSTKTSLARHVKFVHMNERSFMCEECGDTVRTKDQLKEHMLTHTDYAPFECEVCKKCFKNGIRLKNHMECHNPNKHICAECGLQLNSRTTLNRHLLVHSDVMQHKCDYCGRAFKRAKALKNHLILHTGLKPYSCDFCDRTFANGSNCRAHKRKAHPEELAAQEASGEKTFTKNVPKLAVLKSVTQAAEHLAPVASKHSGNFSFGKKPKLLVGSIGTDDRKQWKAHNESVNSTSTTTNNKMIENSNKTNQKHS